MIESKTTLGLLALWLIPGLGPRRIEMLLREFGQIDAVFKAPVSMLARITGLPPENVAAIPDALSSAALEKELSLIETHQLKLIDITQPEYPTLLQEIHDAPPILYTRGEIDYNRGIPIAIVGSRKASYAGKSICRKLIGQLAEMSPECIIVSGLALGIDSAAHKAALEFGLQTVAVLAGGLSSIYPAQNKGLGEQISRHGALLTEFPVQSQPPASNFPLRNRIISGLSKGTVVVEAGDRSGAGITAGYALEQNRELFALPGPADSRFSLGTNRMIQKGQAKLILNEGDILEEIIPGFPGMPSRQLTTCPEDNDLLTQPEILVIDALKTGEQNQNSLAKITGLSVSRLLAALTSLELKGRIIAKPGAVYCQVASCNS